MELKDSSPKSGISPSDCATDPEEKEISEDDDDDRNHKHRRRETQSQSLERDALEQVLTRPYRKRNKPFENGNLYQEGDSQSIETWKNYNLTSLSKDLPAKFEKKRPGLSSFSRGPLDSNQRSRANQSFSGDLGPGRGRGRESLWNQRDSRFSSVDITSQMVQQGSVPPSLFAGRGMPNVSSAHSASWRAFGLVPGIPNGGLDALHSLGLQGALRPPINTSLNIGIPRQRCRDFEERGFCLRGDMCPMEHGVNRIVVEDVQSLSQFNLPVSLPSAHLLGTPAGPVPVPSISGPSSALMNNKGLNIRSSKPGMTDNDLGLNGAFVSSSVAGGADLYDPDQPLWTNDCPQTSTMVLGPNPSNVDENESLLDTDPSGHHHTGLCGISDNEHTRRSAGTAVGSQTASVSVWGRIGGSKNRSEMKENVGATMSSLNYNGDEAKEDHELLSGATHQGKRINADEIGLHAMDSSLKTQGDSGRNPRKPSQKALRTLFINGIPQKNNRREALLSHFRKFGEIIDIYIPSNSERAFVQFSKREEAEAALKAPDAVMGNRFIKLWWANRDSIPDDGISGGNNVSVTPHSVTVAPVSPHPPVGIRGKDNLQPAATKGSVVNASAAPAPAPAPAPVPGPASASDHLKPVVNNVPKAPPPSQKKLETLELLKEQLRRKQQMLDQKRNDFRIQLDKLEKQASGLKGEAASEQNAKRQKIGTVVDVVKPATPKSTNSGTAVSSPQAEVVTDNSSSADSVDIHNPKTNSTLASHEPSSMKHSIRPLAPAGAPFIINRYKLDNRPTMFKIVSPLPVGLANVAVLRDHFSTYGDLSTVELEDSELHDGSKDSSSKSSAHISFKTRHSAEKAFLNGKFWQGHNLQFMWLTPSNSIKDIGGRENTSSSPKESSDANVQPTGDVASTGSEEAAASGNGECGDLERKGRVVECQDEVLQSSSTTFSGKKQSP